ncbi:MAG: protease inhibitor I9 family protein [Actinomycetota bacterium]|nr:protease inhibitor I9 family protein [Actinomycetota bacterium]
MSRRTVTLLTVMAAILLACAGVVLAQETEQTKPPSASQQPAEGEVIPGRYIVVLEDDGRGQAGALAASERRQAGQVAEDLAEEDKVEEVSQTYGAALKGFAAEIPAGEVGAVRSDPRVAFVVEDRGGSTLDPMLVADTETATLAWLEAALEHAYSRDQHLALAYLEAVIEDMVLAEEMAARKTSFVNTAASPDSLVTP